MTIDSVLKNMSASVTNDHATVQLKGAIELDHDPAYFRIYPDSRNRRSYSIVKKSDVEGEVYEWSSEEMLSAGFVNSKIYTIPMKSGAEIQRVSVILQRVGQAGSRKHSEGCGGSNVCCCGTDCTQCSCTSKEDCDLVGGTICSDNHC